MAGVAELPQGCVSKPGGLCEARAAYAAALAAGEGALPIVSMKLDALPAENAKPAAAMEDDPS